MPDKLPDPAEVADAWAKVAGASVELIRAQSEGLTSPKHPPAYDPFAPATAMATFAAQAMTNPVGLFQASSQAAGEWLDLWTRAATGNKEPLVQPERGDRRFSDPAWRDEPVFDYLKQAYLLASRQAVDLVQRAEGVDEATRTKAEFFTQAYLNALSPANFAFTNPAAIRRAIETGNLSLLAGLANLLADAATESKLVQRRVGGDGFELGVNLAATPGSVVYQNELIQLIHYAPTTDTVYKRPLLYVPPLVNRYYLLDLTPKSSMIRWLVEQGHTLFVISNVNPGPELADKGLADWVEHGPIEALRFIEERTGERAVDVFGFCMGGTLAGIAAALLAARSEGDRMASLTTIGSMFDFRQMGQWSAFREPEQLRNMERHLEARGYMAAHDLQALFSLVRANDLIWSSVVSHYLLDQEAPASDLLHWFADGANISRAFLLDWAREVLVANKLKHGGLELRGEAIDLGRVETPLLCISLKDDHVSAWQATYEGAALFGGAKRFLLGGSGHNAGVINPPSANKHGYWVNDAFPPTAEEWIAGAEKREGSWWPEWQGWLVRDGVERVPARVPQGDIEPAPGSYVRRG